MEDWKTIDEYIEAQSEYAQPYLKQIREVLRLSLPDAEERISWKMPTFWKEHNIIHFASFKKHIGLYPGDKAIVHFANQLMDYKTSKGTIQFQYSNPIPLELIKKIAIWCLERNEKFS